MRQPEHTCALRQIHPHPPRGGNKSLKHFMRGTKFEKRLGSFTREDVLDAVQTDHREMSQI